MSDVMASELPHQKNLTRLIRLPTEKDAEPVKNRWQPGAAGKQEDGRHMRTAPQAIGPQFVDELMIRGFNSATINEGWDRPVRGP
jgi:hypothetical protein